MPPTPYRMPNVFIAGPITRAPDAVHFQDDLGDTAWENYSANGIHAHGRQGSFDILTDGDPTQGLRVTVERGLHREASQTNGFMISVTVGNALDVTLTSSMQTVEIVLAAATTMAQLKTAVDNVSGLDSEYFGGETGTGATDAQDVPDISNATRDRPAVVRVACDDAILIQMSNSRTAPNNNNNGAELIHQGTEAYRYVPPGLVPWFRRAGTADADGSVAIFRGEEVFD